MRRFVFNLDNTISFKDDGYEDARVSMALARMLDICLNGMYYLRPDRKFCDLLSRAIDENA